MSASKRTLGVGTDTVYIKRYGQCFTCEWKCESLSTLFIELVVCVKQLSEMCVYLNFYVTAGGDGVRGGFVTCKSRCPRGRG